MSKLVFWLLCGSQAAHGSTEQTDGCSDMACLASEETTDDLSLLQAWGQVGGRQSVSKSKQGESLFGPDHFIQFDGSKKTEVPRVQKPSTFVREVLVRYPLESNNIEVQGDRVFIPFTSVLEGTFSRNAKAGEQKDFGVVKAAAFAGGTSMISDRVKLAFAEKSHTLHFPHKVHSYTEQKLEAMKRKQTPQEAKLAREKANNRHLSLAKLGAPLGVQIIDSGKDTQHVAAVREYVAQNNGKVTKAIGSGWQRADKEMEERRKLVKSTKPIRSSIGCMHFENAEDMEFVSNGEYMGAVVPLDKMITGYRGRLASVPNAEYQMSTGVTFFHHNKEKKSLDIYLGFSAVVGIYDTAAAPVANFLVGPIDGVGSEISPDGRGGSKSLGMMTSHFASEVSKYPVDFQFLHMHRQDLGCNDDQLVGLAKNIKGVQTVLQGMLKPSMSTMLHAMMNLGSAMSNAEATLTTQVNCAVEFLKPKDKSQLISYGVFEAVGLLHVLMEMPGAVQAASFSTSETWNDFNFTLEVRPSIPHLWR